MKTGRSRGCLLAAAGCATSIIVAVVVGVIALRVLAVPVAGSQLRYGAAEDVKIHLATREGARQVPARLQEITFAEPGGKRTFGALLVTLHDPASQQFWWGLVRGTERHAPSIATMRDVSLPTWRFFLDRTTVAAFQLTYPLLQIRPLSMRFASLDEGDRFVKATQVEHALTAHHPVTINAAREWSAVNVTQALGTSFGTVEPGFPARWTVSLIDVTSENDHWYLILKNGDCKRAVITLNAAFLLEDRR